MSSWVSLELTTKIVAAENDQDRIGLFQSGDFAVLVIADGAGGMNGGAEAAERAVLDLSRLALLKKRHSKDCIKALKDLDLQIYRDKQCGETTAIVIVESQGEIVGASVGDSEAWLISKETVNRLTSSQRRKPFIGSGACQPVGFGPVKIQGQRLLMATDGLFKYTDRAKIQELLQKPSLEGCLEALADLVRMKSGRLQDDLAVILGEVNP